MLQEGSVYQGLVFYPQGYNVPDNLVEDGGKLSVLASLLKQIYTATPRDKVVLVANYTKVKTQFILLFDFEKKVFIFLPFFFLLSFIFLSVFFFSLFFFQFIFYIE